MNSARPSAHWIPLMDYAMKKGVSLSTLRRHIKANKIAYKIENGKYLLPDEATHGAVASSDSVASFARPLPAASAVFTAHTAAPDAINDQLALQLTVQGLRQDLQRAHEEIAELKTLIALYEERLPNTRFDV